MVSLGALFKVFVRIGATGFGGPMALLAIIHEQVVERRKMVSQEAFSEAMAIGQMLPGPVAVDAVTHIGHRLRGLRGAIVATVAIILPPFLLMLVLAPLYLSYGSTPQLAGAFKGIGAGVVALIVAAAYRMGKPALGSAWQVALALGAFGALAWLEVSPVVALISCGVIGAIFLRPRPAPSSQTDEGGKGRG